MSYKASINITTDEPSLFPNISNVSISNAFRNIGKHFEAVGIGAISEAVIVNSGLVYGSVTFTIASGNLSDEDTLTINSVVLSAETVAANNTEFNVGSGALATAMNCAACINANPSLSPLFKAVATAGASQAGVVTITALVPSTTSYTLSKSATNGTLSSTTLSGTAGAVSAANVFTILVGNLADEDTVTVGTQLFAAETSAGAGLAEFTIGATALATAQALAAIINTYPTTATVFKAVAAVGSPSTSAIVTVTVLAPGLVGNHIPVAKSVGTAANGVWTTNTAAFVGGADANVVTLHHGI